MRFPATQRIDDPARRGGDLVLTLDQSLQYEVEKQLTAQVESAKARGGIAIVADVKTGDVLAMASVDGGDAQHHAQLAPATESNRPLTAVYEPGSTAKVVTVGAALEEGVVEPTTSFWVPDKLQISDRLFKDAEDHADASWTVNDIVRESSNIGVIKIAEKLGPEKLDHYQRAFGFGSKTAIDFPAESAGIMKNVDDYVPADMGSIPIGYTTAVTPMQMLDVFTTVANGGTTVPPRLVAATIDSDGERHEQPAPNGRRVVSEKTAEELNQMLRGVVTGGTGTQAQISGYTVAGKTGTSRKPRQRRRPSAVHGELRRVRAGRGAAPRGDRRDRPARDQRRGVLRRQGRRAALLADHAVRAAPRARAADDDDVHRGVGPRTALRGR